MANAYPPSADNMILILQKPILLSFYNKSSYFLTFCGLTMQSATIFSKEDTQNPLTFSYFSLTFLGVK